MTSTHVEVGVGIRELANRAGGVVDAVTRSGRPALITKRGRPVAGIVPIEGDERRSGHRR